jgi:hypothetical protein
MKFWAAMVVLAGCGRFAFDPARADAELADTPVAAFSCPTGPAPDPLTISGKAFRYTNFTNGMSPIDSADVRAYAGGMQVGAATTAPDGSYTMDVATGGAAMSTYLTYNKSTYLLTRVFLDGLLDRDLVAGMGGLWNPGDGPLWDDTQMNMIYAAANVTRTAGAGAINVGVRDCANNPIPGVVVTFDPPPSSLRYQDDSGMPNATLTETGAAFGHVLALNPQSESTHVTAMKDGLRFSEATFTVSPTTNNLVLLHGGP